MDPDDPVLFYPPAPCPSVTIHMPDGGTMQSTSPTSKNSLHTVDCDLCGKWISLTKNGHPARYYSHWGRKRCKINQQQGPHHTEQLVVAHQLLTVRGMTSTGPGTSQAASTSDPLSLFISTSSLWCHHSLFFLNLPSTPTLSTLISDRSFIPVGLQQSLRISCIVLDKLV